MSTDYCIQAETITDACCHTIKTSASSDLRSFRLQIDIFAPSGMILVKYWNVICTHPTSTVCHTTQIYIAILVAAIHCESIDGKYN